MKVIFAVEYYYPSVGGAQFVVEQLAERFASTGHKVIVVTTRLDERVGDVHKGVSIVSFDIRGNQAVGMSGDIHAYQDFLISTRSDVIFFYAAQQWTFDAAIPILGKLDSAKVFVPCGYSGLFREEYSDYYHHMPDVLRQMDMVVYHAESYRDLDFAKKFGLNNHVIIPNGADLQEFDVPINPSFRSIIGANEQDLLLLTVGAFTGSKGHLEVAEAFALADFDGRTAFLILNGNHTTPTPDSELAKLIALSKEVGWFRTIRHKLFRFLMPWRHRKKSALQTCIDDINSGRFGEKKAIRVDMSREQLVQAFLQSNLFVFASNIEYSPLVLFEACAAGLPFVSVPVGNSREIVEWTGGGIICEAPTDKLGYCRVLPTELARCIEKLIADPEMLAILSNLGRISARMRYNWESLALEYEKLFLSLVESAENLNTCQSLLVTAPSLNTH